jgi:hypothetical protein
MPAPTHTPVDLTDEQRANLAKLAAAHTPGPWSATNHFANDGTPCNCAYVLSEGYAGSICEVSFNNGLAVGDGGNDSPPKEEAAANAYLIAAAPDLLTALVDLEHYLRNTPHHNSIEAAAARKAIAQVQA